jgi:hypothetical protein
MRIRDTGWKKLGSEMENIRIRDKHLGSATLIKTKTYLTSPTFFVVLDLSPRILMLSKIIYPALIPILP